MNGLCEYGLDVNEGYVTYSVRISGRQSDCVHIIASLIVRGSKALKNSIVFERSLIVMLMALLRGDMYEHEKFVVWRQK